MLRASVVVSSALVVAAVTPMEKVITLVSGLKQGVVVEGKAEAKVYDQFACFCKDTTLSKSDSIMTGRDNIQSLSASIALNTATREEKATEVKERQIAQETLSTQLSEMEANFAKDRAIYEAAAADLGKAIRSCNSALRAVRDATPASLLEVHRTLHNTLDLVELMGLGAETNGKAIRSFLQLAVDPSNPDYEFHSHGIVDLLTKLLGEFSADKLAAEGEWTTTKQTYEDGISNLQLKLVENSVALSQLSSDIDTLKGAIAKARESLVSADATLKDDQQYLQDLTERCEVRAKDWDQRSKLRADEVTALSKVLELLQGKVATADADVNLRAASLLQRQPGKVVTVTGRATTAAHKKAGNALLVKVKEHAPALLQMAASSQLRGASALRSRQDRVAELLGQEGKRIGSVVLSQLAFTVSADPFAKVKNLIQGLVERLLAEATAEATKKGFCDEQLGKAHNDRDFRLRDTEKLDVEIENLQIKVIELRAEIEELTDNVLALQETLKKAIVDRAMEHDENLATMKGAKEGQAAISEAIATLKAFYGQAAKATSLVQASPVDEDTAGAGFDGAYKGKQDASTGIIGLMEVIKSDFERTYQETEAAEKNSHEEFVEFDRASKADIGAKETQMGLNQEDAATTVNTIASKMEDLKTAATLLDEALKQEETLKPTCMDTGMSFEERVAKREEEISALQKALCMLDSEGVEPDCVAAA